MVGDGQTDRLTAQFMKRMALTHKYARGINCLSEAWKSDPYWVSWAQAPVQIRIITYFNMELLKDIYIQELNETCLDLAIINQVDDHPQK